MKRALIAVLLLAFVAYGAVLAYKIYLLSKPPGGEVKIPEITGITVAVDDRPSALLVQSMGDLVRTDDLDIRIVVVDGAPSRWQKLAVGEIDVALGTLDSFTLGYIRQKGMAIVADVAFYGGSDALVVPSSCGDLASLARKRLALVPDSAGAYLLSWFLEREKIASPDIRTLAMPTAGDALTALLQGRVDGAILWEPYRSQAIKKGFKEIASSKGTRIIEEVMAASSNALSSKRAKLSAFLGAWFQLQALLEKNPAMAFKLIARKTSRAPSDLSTAFEGLALITLQENQALEPEKLVEKMKVLQRYWIIEGEPNAVLNTDFDRAVSLDTVKGLRIEESAPLFGETPMPIAASSPAEETPTPEETPSETPSKTPAASPTPKTSPGLPGDTSVKFLPGSFELDTKAVEKVRGWIAYMKEHGETKAVLHGWADIEETRTWSPARISESRARRVREEMTKRGIDESRITIKAEGLSKDPLGSAGNRRVDIEITPGG